MAQGHLSSLGGGVFQWVRLAAVADVLYTQLQRVVDNCKVRLLTLRRSATLKKKNPNKQTVQDLILSLGLDPGTDGCLREQSQCMTATYTAANGVKLTNTAVLSHFFLRGWGGGMAFYNQMQLLVPASCTM